MPRIELVSPVYYSPDDPYHYLYDNLPLKNIFTRQLLINLAVDNLIEQMTDAVGTQNTVANRLNQSIDADGSLKAQAIDDANHSIEAHADTANYVRMSKAQSDKLTGIAAGATNVSVEIQRDDEGDDVVAFTSGVVRFVPSSTVSLSVDGQNHVSMNLGFPVESAHKHYYDQTPVHETPLTPDYLHYKVSSLATPFIQGSLRVYVNGMRLSATDDIYVPNDNNVWTLLHYTPDYAHGRFVLSAAVTASDVVRVDYDTSFA